MERSERIDAAIEAARVAGVAADAALAGLKSMAPSKDEAGGPMTVDRIIQKAIDQANDQIRAISIQPEDCRNKEHDSEAADFLRDMQLLKQDAYQLEVLAAKRLRLAFSDLLMAERCRICRIKMLTTALVSDLRCRMASLLQRLRT